MVYKNSSSSFIEWFYPIGPHSLSARPMNPIVVGHPNPVEERESRMDAQLFRHALRPKFEDRNAKSKKIPQHDRLGNCLLPGGEGAAKLPGGQA
jgi:hypothetical protein